MNELANGCLNKSFKQQTLEKMDDCDNMGILNSYLIKFKHTYEIFFQHWIDFSL
jgi:hypothetical protein